MARSFAVLVLLYLGGGLVCLVVTGNLWPLILGGAALYLLAPKFKDPPGGADGPPGRPPEYLGGRPDRRMPS